MCITNIAPKHARRIENAELTLGFGSKHECALRRDCGIEERHANAHGTGDDFFPAGARRQGKPLQSKNIPPLNKGVPQRYRDCVSLSFDMLAHPFFV